MTKRGQKKAGSGSEKKHTEHHEHHESQASFEHTLVKNLVELQKIHADLAEKFDKLSKEISQMLALFELTARSFAKNVPMAEYEKDKEFLEKIDKLLEQNKILAKGLTLMEERLRERMYEASPQTTQSQQTQTKETEKKNTQESEQGEFRPSIASSNRPLPKF